MDEHNQTAGGNQIPPAPYPAGGVSGLAVASLVLGILGIFTCLPALPALILGIVALNQIGANPQRGGKGLAVAWIVLSAMAVIALPIMAALVFPVFAKAREMAKEQVCLTNVKNLENAMMAYAADHDGAMPPADKWQEALRQYPQGPKLVFTCPATPEGTPSYAMNSRLSRIKAKSIASPSTTVLLFDSAPGANRYGGSSLLPAPQRHHHGNSIGFADGHAKSVPSPDVASLNWEPK